MNRQPSFERLLGPLDLAKAVYQYLDRKNIHFPITSEALSEIFETLFYLSLHTEEDVQIRCSVTYLPTRGRNGRSPSFLSKPLDFTFKALLKLAQAVDPEQGSLHIFPDAKGHLKIWDVLDQFPLHMQRSRNWESERWGFSPGIFHAVITAPGEITVYIRDFVVAILRKGRLITTFHDVIWRGPISKKLQPAIKRYQQKVKAAVGARTYNSWGEWFIGTDEEFLVDRDWSEDVGDFWRGSLCRILLAIQRYRHGGALLLVPRRNLPHLAIKYAFKYSSLTKSLISYAESFINQSSLETRARRGQLDTTAFTGDSTASKGFFQTPDDRENIFVEPVREWENEILFKSWQFQAHRTRALGEIAGAVGLIASFTRIDGLVLLQDGLDVAGFGAVIQTRDKVGTVFLAQDEPGILGLTPVHADSFGTRHRSMFNYCSNHPQAVGFVISQDGDVRAVTRVGKRVVVWENIRLHAGSTRAYLPLAYAERK